MAGFLRHLSALTRKNFINWKRTWVGSFLEIGFPVICMLLVSLSHKWANPVNQNLQEFLYLAYAQYPVTNPVGIRWVLTKQQSPELNEFLNFANITQDSEDFFQRNPGFFWPEHCYGYGSTNSNYTSFFNETEDSSLAPRRNYTAIGYIQANNQIERDVLAQLQLMFTKQQEIFPEKYHKYTYVKFNTQKELDDYVKHPGYTYEANRPGLCFAFQILKQSDTRFEISLMFNDQFDTDFAGSGIPRQANAVWNPIKPQANIRAFYKYMTGGYSIMQNLIANTILRSVTNQTASIAVITVPQNQQPYTTDPLIEQVLVQWLPLATLIAYLFPVFRVCQRMVAEKETQVRDSMRMMGLNEIAYWCSWLIYYLVINIIVSSLCTIVLYSTLFKYSDWFLVWLFFFMYGLSLFGFVTLVQAFFQNSRYSAVFSAVLYGALYGVNSLVQSSDVLEKGKNWASLIPQVALSLIVPNLGAYEAVGIGMNFSNVKEQYQNYTVSNGFLMLLLDFVLYTLIGIYIDNVMPRESGMQKPLSFGFSYLRASYWDFFDLCTCKKRKSSQKYLYLRDAAKRKAELEDHDFYNFETKYIRPENFEAPDISMQMLEKKRRFLKILDLQKQYSNGYRAVDGINLRMYEGQIFALLGHNGAGKTTTIQMMTGMLEPSEGEAFVYGYRVFSQGDMDTLRRYMGVCPQHNVLFDLLTPFETIRVFQEFKGAIGSRKEKLAEVEKLLKDVGIWDFRKTLGKNLSGGNKRKLSVAIALCGQSKFVMLDEPTAGMDLQARRNLWNMLRAYRNDRIIILTTHYMDEADVLGDRIGIMQNGRLVTVGSSLFLKRRYGVGYKFTFEKVRDEQAPFNIDNIENYLKERLSPEVKLLSDIGAEVTFQVPTECSERFKEFFTGFDSKLADLQIQGYGISVTSLEEVFLKVGTEDQSIENEKNVDVANSDQEAQLRDIIEYSVADQKSHINFCANIRAMCFKRSKLERRRWRTVLFSEMLIPNIFVLLGVWITQWTTYVDSPDRRLQTKLYPLPQRIQMNLEPVINATDQTPDNVSIPPIVDNFPSSYTLLTDDDFVVKFNNYTDEYLEGFELRKNGTSRNQTFDYFSQFNDDSYAMRQDGKSEPYRFGSYLVYQADKNLSQYKIINYVNTTSQDAAAAFPQFMYESILKTATNQSNFQFRVTTNPFPISQRYRDQEKKTSTIGLISVIAIGLSIIPANVVGAILRERERNLKHLQLISGLNLVAYHFVNILFDILKAELVVFNCCYFFFIWPNLKEYYWSLLILALWPIGVIPITHALSFLFKSEWWAQFWIIFFNLIILGAIPYAVSSLMFNQNTTDLAEKLNNWSLLLPGYSLSRAFIFCGFQETLNRFKLSIGKTVEIQQIWSNTNFVLNVVAIVVYHFLGLILVLIADNVFGLPNCFKTCLQKIEHKLLNCCLQKKGFTRVEEFEDDDVKAEEARVESTDKSQLQVKVSNFSKVYRQGLNRILAVRKASFGLDFGECFVLLGVNGAGKTTTFRSLTNETDPTGGEVSIGGFDITKKFSKARKLIGFCPQENVLFDQLTVEEHLYFYALLKGIPKRILKQIIQYTIKEMDLENQRRKNSSALSGGNKRKLQVAIAIIGNPPIILLDEPSAGMDPQARRFMWSVIAQLNKKREKCAVILTTHSMEEAEALGTKLGIMVRGGQFRCFGSAQHIKNKFGTGFEVEVKIKPLSDAELNKLLLRFSISEFITKMPLTTATEQMRSAGFFPELLDEIRATGLGDELIRESRLDSGGQVRIKHLMEWVHNMRHGMRVVRTFAQEFGTIVLLEQYSDYFKIRFGTQGKSIGYVFGAIEEQKDKFGIAEYSVSQTTLEQIFQMFANSKRADVDDIEDQDKITFEYTPKTETSEFELIIKKNNQ